MRPHRCTNTEPALQSSADCVDDQTLMELAAGIAPPKIMEKHGGHIANCDRCALLLKRYLFEFSDEVTPEEEAILNELETSKPEGQNKLLEKMLRHTNQHQGRQTES